MQPPGHDDSEPGAIKAGAGARVHVTPPEGAAPEDARVEGRVVAVRPADRGAVQVDLDSGGTFAVALPGDCPLPFGEGDAVSARSRIEFRGIHVIRHGTVLDAAGAVLVACSEDGDPSYAPGWSLESGPVARRGPASGGLAPRNSHWLALRHGGRTAWVADRCWRELSAGGRRWAVSGEAERHEPGLPLPPDAASYDTYAIVRLGGGAPLPDEDPGRDAGPAPDPARDGELSAPFPGDVGELAPLAERHARTAVRWSATLSVMVPYQADVEGATWVLRLNDFPEEPMYTLFADGRALGSLSDWPDAWSKPGILGLLARARLVPWARDVARRARQG